MEMTKWLTHCQGCIPSGPECFPEFPAAEPELSFAVMTKRQRPIQDLAPFQGHFDPRRERWNKYTPLERLLQSVDVGGSPIGCWRWTRSTDREGYGFMKFRGRQERAHRVAWELLEGPIPPGLELDHRECENKSCVNVDHLEVVTGLVNTQRGCLKNRKRVCVRGHPLEGPEADIYERPNDRDRECRACMRIRDRARKRR